MRQNSKAQCRDEDRRQDWTSTQLGGTREHENRTTEVKRKGGGEESRLER